MKDALDPPTGGKETKGNPPATIRERSVAIRAGANPGVAKELLEKKLAV